MADSRYCQDSHGDANRRCKNRIRKKYSWYDNYDSSDSVFPDLKAEIIIVILHKPTSLIQLTDFLLLLIIVQTIVNTGNLYEIIEVVLTVENGPRYFVVVIHYTKSRSQFRLRELNEALNRQLFVSGLSLLGTTRVTYFSHKYTWWRGALRYFSGKILTLTDGLVTPPVRKVGIVGALTNASSTFRLRCKRKLTLDVLLAGIADTSSHCWNNVPYEYLCLQVAYFVTFHARGMKVSRFSWINLFIYNEIS